MSRQLIPAQSCGAFNRSLPGSQPQCRGANLLLEAFTMVFVQGMQCKGEGLPSFTLQEPKAWVKAI